MDKEDVLHTYNGILLSHKRDEIMPFAAIWIDLEMIKLREVIQSFIYMTESLWCTLETKTTL